MFANPIISICSVQIASYGPHNLQTRQDIVDDRTAAEFEADHEAVDRFPIISLVYF